MTWFLVISLFFPRLCLLVAYFSSSIPNNDVPLFFDFLGFAIVPKLLIMYYIWYAELGIGWIIAHAIALIISKVINSEEKD